ncbi:hypothetical protein CAOG_00156 [Capsaspora owczarzaki ATCC 30864]|uniref:hypothetical protein n=1 Tax=Capsaspora owczarzaki (strain ATCC 30864) TaxID=595528 RepID=UPI0003520D81|nr:hypothetical protein CAOG_00156 [Capsaspora owczarzaki ATCC 30864]|eukprot:XP_004365027.2 hypothetical protein CAOG_00156 [Capsaspora owczarzaki ATCC 30864]
MRRRSSAIALIPILLVVLSCFERAAAQSACTMCQCQAGNVVFCYGVSAVPSDFPIDTTYIFFSVSPLTSVPSNAFDGLNQLTRLTFLQTGLTAIPFNAISSITTLQSLTFSPATYLAADLTGNQFTGFPSLTYLDLKNVEFSNFAANAFNGLSQLTSLSLTMTGTATATATSFPVFSALTYFYLDTPAVGSSASTELFAKMPALSTLYMAQTRVTSLAPNAFAGLSNLTTLALWGTGITSFPDHAFAQLSSLQSLSLHSVPVTTIAASAFSGLTSLTSLTLDVHLLTSLPTNVFQDLTSLRDLDMSRGPYGVGICFTGVFQSLTELSTLHMNWGEPCALHTHAFTGLSALETLNLYGPVDSIADNVFEPLPSLKSLNLIVLPNLTLASNAYSGLQELPTLSLKLTQLNAPIFEMFSALHALTTLDLSASQFSVLPSHAFAALPQLTNLYLGNGAWDPVISSVASDAFSDLLQLEFLSMGGNYETLTTLPPGLFYGLTKLRTADLSGNAFPGPSAPPSTYGSPSNPTPCNASCVTCFAAGAESCCSANCLTCTSTSVCTACYNGFVLANGRCWAPTDACAVCTCTGTDVQLCSSSLTAIPTNIPVTTTYLNLWETKISSLSSNAFAGLTALTSLYVPYTADSPLRNIESNAFSGLPSLRTLYISYQPNATVAASAFAGLELVREVGLQVPQLNHISSQLFASLPGVTALITVDSMLSVIPANAFVGLTNVQHLIVTDIAGSPMVTSVSSRAFAGLVNVQSITLADNPGLTTLPPGLFQGLTSLQSPSNSLRGNGFAGPNAPPSTYGDYLAPIPCNASCATCFAAGAESCCSANCLTCTSATNCTACYGGRILQQGVCISPANDSASTSPLPVIVGATIGGIVAVFALLLLLVVLRRRRSHKPGQPQQVHNVVATVGSRNSVFRSSKKAEAEGHGTNAYEAAMAHDSNTHNPLYEALSDHPESFYASTDMYASVSPTYMNAGATAQSTPNQELHYVGPDLATGSTRPELAASTSNYAVIAGTASSDPTYANLH